MKKYLIGILVFMCILLRITPAHADYLYTFEWPSKTNVFEYEIDWSFTVPTLLSSTTEFSVTELSSYYSSYGSEMVSISIIDPETTSPEVKTSFGDGLSLTNFAYGMAFDAVGKYINYNMEDNGTLIISECQSSIPEPTTMLLLGTGLIGLVGFRRKFKK